MSGSSLPAIQERANRSCSLVRSLARYAPHSIVCSVTLTPTALRLDWITVDIATGDCMPEPDSGTHSVVENPLGYPASASSFRARSGSYGYGLSAESAPQVFGRTG